MGIYIGTASTISVEARVSAQKVELGSGLDTWSISVEHVDDLINLLNLAVHEIGAPIRDLERAIHEACDQAGARPPKITHYANCIAVAFRNGDNLRVLVTLDLDVKPEAAAHKIAQAFKVKAENQPSEATLHKLAE